MKAWLEANVAKHGRIGASDLVGTILDILLQELLQGHILKGAWDDTGVAMMHMCQCLEQRLPGHLHSLSMNVRR